MKKINAIIFIGSMLLGGSCKKSLDINTNPNSATSATPELVLPQAITATAAGLSSFNAYGSQTVGYAANAGGYGGFGTAITYNYSSSDWSGLWSATYHNLEDYQYILDHTAGQLPLYNYFNAAARIMKAFDFQLLVDAYNDIPYTDALKGDKNLTPSYSSATTIYPSLAAQLDSAIATINAATTATKPLGVYDVIFAGDMTKWKQFANTIKLKLLLHANGKATISNTSFDAAGFITTDAMINPGYARDNNRENPAWDSWAFSNTGGDRDKAWMPNTYVMGFYDGHKLVDSFRGSAVYYKFPKGDTITNELGFENTSVTSCPSGSFWYCGTNRDGKSAGDTIGILKGPNAGYPIMPAAESYFMQAEAVVKGLITSASTPKVLFDTAILASFRYLYKLPDGTLSLKDSVVKSYDSIYLSNNSTSYLVNFDLAVGVDQQTEAIITQKYIALNFIDGFEAWNDYRRTHYPAVVTSATPNPQLTFASTVSQSTRADKLPTRLLYPQSEGVYNPKNVPRNISPFTSLIFWALQ